MNLNPGQEKCLNSRSPFGLLAGGFGSSKSTALQLKALQLKLVNKTVPGLMMAAVYGELFSNIVDPFMALCANSLPRQWQPRVSRDQEGRKQIVWPDGCVIHLRSADNEHGWAGLNVGWMVGDELRLWRHEMYRTAIARVRVPCPLSQRFFASTPNMGWMADEYNANLDRHELITMPTRENLHNLAPDYIDNLRSSYSPRVQRALLDGEFTILEGAVFDAFDPNPKTSPWIIDFEPTPQYLREHKVMLAIDFGFRRSAWAWVVQTAALEWVVFDELILDHTSDAEAVDMVNAREYPVDEIWCDPAGDNTQSLVALDSFTALRNIKPRNQGTRLVRIVTAFNGIAFGVDKLRVLLGGYQSLPIRLKFSKKLAALEAGKPRGAIKSIGTLRYPEPKDGHAVYDIPLKDGIHDHFADALRYWAVGRWMTEPSLRGRDPMLAKLKEPGYKIAA